MHQKYAAGTTAALKSRRYAGVCRAFARSRLSISVKDCAIEREARAFVRSAHCSVCGASECPARARWGENLTELGGRITLTRDK